MKAQKSAKPVVSPAKANKTVLVQQWEESERGWGTRPDGYSIHLTNADRDVYVKTFLDRQHKLLGDEVPDEYTRTCGSPYLAEVDIATYRKLKKTDNGLMINDNKYPKRIAG